MPRMTETQLNKMHYVTELRLIETGHDGGRWRELAMQRIESLAAGEDPELEMLQSNASKAKSHLQAAPSWGDYGQGCGIYIEQMAKHGNHKDALNIASVEAGLLPPAEVGRTSALSTIEPAPAAPATPVHPADTSVDGVRSEKKPLKSVGKWLGKAIMGTDDPEEVSAPKRKHL